jgi:ADP-ribose pyrophosphatase YjhB (NUDIX family)
MVSKINPLDTIKVPTGQGDLENLVFFFSVDIVGSTALKQRNNDWQEVIRSFFQRSRELIKGDEPVSNAQSLVVWKYLGDEIVFISDLTSKDQLHLLTEACYNILTNLADYMESKDPELSAKGTVWIVPVDGQQNIYLYGEDYLGRHVDAGFRVAKEFARQRQLALSFEVSILLSEKTATGSKLHFLGFRHLKGVWQDRYYPVVWYAPGSESIKKLPYDLSARCELTRKFIRQIETHEVGSDRVARELEKIDHEFSKTDLSSIKSYLESHRHVKSGREHRRQKTEIHNALVVIHPSEKKVLLHKRTGDREIHPTKWACPGGHIHHGESLEASCTRKGREELNLEVKPITDLVVPYFIGASEAGGIGINGFRVQCCIEDSALNTIEKNESLKWFSVKEIELLEKNGETVPDLSSQIKRILT